MSLGDAADVVVRGVCGGLKTYRSTYRADIGLHRCVGNSGSTTRRSAGRIG